MRHNITGVDNPDDTRRWQKIDLIADLFGATIPSVSSMLTLYQTDIIMRHCCNIYPPPFSFFKFKLCFLRSMSTSSYDLHTLL